MKNIFETFKPQQPIVAKYVDYYYLDLKPENEITEFECFPHYNNTISLYSSHHRSNGETIYDEQHQPLQIFTPVRDQVLHVKQKGKVHRIVIVFNILGIQQFYKDLDVSGYILNAEFFTRAELENLFLTNEINTLGDLLDEYLLQRYEAFKIPVLDLSIESIFLNYENFSVEDLANYLQITRRHLNRLFKTHIGVSIKKFQKIVLFRKAIEQKLFVSPEENFTALAYELNFSDQAHLNKTFGNLTQNSPKQFFRKGTLLGKQDTFWHLIQ